MDLRRLGSVLLATVLALVLATQATATGKTPPKARHGGQLVVYYLHGHFRCASCLKIEAYTREAVEKGFAADLKKHKVEWKVLDIEDPGNQHFVTDYQLTTKSVVLSRVKGGKEIAWENLPKIWPLLNDKKEFQSYIQTEIRRALKGL